MGQEVGFVRILFEDEELLAVEKPSGLLSVPGRGEDKQDCVISRLLPNYPALRSIHRLDRDTSGILLLALTADAQRQLGRQFETRRVEKRYEAIVTGFMENESGEIDLPLAKDFSSPPRHRVDHVFGRTSQTSYRVISKMRDKQGSPATQLSLIPHTGRSHQLRVHLASIGHPILGDPLYAQPEIQAASSRLMLHACELKFDHPRTGKRLELSSSCYFRETFPFDQIG